MPEPDSQQEEYCSTVERLSFLVRQFESLPYPQLRDSSTELLQTIDALHRGPLERLVAIMREGGYGGLLDRLEKDPIVGHLFLLYDLIPCDEVTAVEAALYPFWPYVQAHGGDLELLGVEDGVVRIRLMGNCQECAGAGTSLRRSLEGVLREGFPGFRSLQLEDLRATSDGCADGLDRPTPECG